MDGKASLRANQYRRDQDSIEMRQRFQVDGKKKVANLCREASAMAIPYGNGRLATVLLSIVPYAAPRCCSYVRWKGYFSGCCQLPLAATPRAHTEATAAQAVDATDSG